MHSLENKKCITKVLLSKRPAAFLIRMYGVNIDVFVSVTNNTHRIVKYNPQQYDEASVLYLTEFQCLETCIIHAFANAAGYLW